MVYPRRVRLEEENTNKMISDDKKKKGMGASLISLTESPLYCVRLSYTMRGPLPKLANAQPKRKRATVNGVSKESSTREKE